MDRAQSPCCDEWVASSFVHRVEKHSMHRLVSIIDLRPRIYRMAWGIKRRNRRENTSKGRSWDPTEDVAIGLLFDGAETSPHQHIRKGELPPVLEWNRVKENLLKSNKNFLDKKDSFLHIMDF